MAKKNKIKETEYVEHEVKKYDQLFSSFFFFLIYKRKKYCQPVFKGSKYKMYQSPTLSQIWNGIFVFPWVRAQKRFVLSHKALSFLNSLISKTFLRNVDFHPGICDQVTFCARLTDHFKAAAVNEEWGAVKGFFGGFF